MKIKIENHDTLQCSAYNSEENVFFWDKNWGSEVLLGLPNSTFPRLAYKY